MTWPKHCTIEKELGKSVMAIATAKAENRNCAPTQYISALAEVTNLDSELRARTSQGKALLIGISEASQLNDI